MGHPIVNQIVDRVHVGKSNRYVLRVLRASFSKVIKITREDRKRMYRFAINRHKENQKAYGWVMGGGHGYTRRKSGRKAKG